MSEPLVRPIVLDATVLSNFASTDSVTWLANRYVVRDGEVLHADLSGLDRIDE